MEAFKVANEKEMRQKEIEFQKEEKEKDRKLVEKKERVELAIACINSGRSIDEIKKILRLFCVD